MADQLVTPPRPGGVVRTGALSMVALAALGLTRLVHGSLVSRATDPQTYGRVGVLIALTTIASLLLPAGVASATSKYVPYLQGGGEPDAARGAYRLLSRLGLAGSVVLGLAAAALARALFDLGTGDTAQVGALGIAFSLYSIDKATLYGYQKVPAYVRLELCTSGLAVVATVVVVTTGSRAYLVPLALGYGVFAVVARWLVRREVRGPVTASPQAPGPEILGYVALACLGTVASNGFLQGTQLLAAHFATVVEVAYFTAAVTLVTPMYFLPRALGLALFPAMARAHGAGDTEGVRRQADLSTRALLVVLAPVFAAGILLAREVLILFGGARYASGAPVLQLMLAATYLAVCAVAAVNTLSSGHGWQLRTPVLSGVTGCLTGLAVVAALGGPLGAAGVGIGYLAGTAVTAAGPMVVVWRRYHMPWLNAAVRAIATVAVALAAGLALRGSGTARVLLDVAAAVVVALAGAALLGGELRDLFTSVRRR